MKGLLFPMYTKKSKIKHFRNWVMPISVSVTGLSITALGIILLVRFLRAEIVDEDADVENFDIVKNKPFFI